LLPYVETKYAFSLDRDELLVEVGGVKPEIGRLIAFIKANPARGYNFQSRWIFPDFPFEAYSGTFNPRIFEVSTDARYVGIGERGKNAVLYLRDKPFCDVTRATVNTGMSIKHFCPSFEVMQAKYAELYGDELTRSIHGIERRVGKENLPFLAGNAPSQLAHFWDWKRFNPRREEFR
jgi:hypothetical protein